MQRIEPRRRPMSKALRPSPAARRPCRRSMDRRPAARRAVPGDRSAPAQSPDRPHNAAYLRCRGFSRQRLAGGRHQPATEARGAPVDDARRRPARHQVNLGSNRHSSAPPYAKARRQTRRYGLQVIWRITMPDSRKMRRGRFMRLPSGLLDTLLASSRSMGEDQRRPGRR